jgi:hypothetical protein
MNLIEGSYMDLPIEIITMDSLMKRWGMSFMDIVLVVVNYSLKPVYREYSDLNWKKFGEDPFHDILDQFFDSNADARKIIFLRSDVQLIEDEFGGHVSKSTEIIHEKDTVQRMGISEIELWNLQETLAIDLYDPFGFRIDIDKLDGISALIPGEGLLEYYFKQALLEYYFKQADVEKLEREFGSGTIQHPEKKPKLRPNQRHKIKCRELAELHWQENPETTIADIAFSGDIIAACDGKMYAEKTIRGWIKDLCPNRSPGRRPKV